MFWRGQKIVVIESSAKGGAHPKKNDIGYLDNLYLFPNYRFILMDAFFFGYKKDIKRNVARKAEKKRLVINLGMTPKLLSDVTKNGITRQSFSGLGPICLTSVGCKPYAFPETFVEYPQFIGPYGVWSKSNSMMANTNAKVKVPCGNIAPFSSVSNRKCSLKDCDNEELSAWLRTMNSMMIFIWSAFSGLDSHKVRNSTSKRAESIWVGINKYFSIDTANGAGGAKNRKFSIEVPFLSSNEKNHVIEQIRKLETLCNIVLHGQDVAFLNRANNMDNGLSMRKVEALWQEFSITTLRDKKASLPTIRGIAIVLRSIFFRSVIMSKDIRNQLGILSKYFPSLGIDSNKNVHLFQSIQRDANNSSAALARVFDSSLVFKRYLK